MDGSDQRNNNSALKRSEPAAHRAMALPTVFAHIREN